MTKKIFREILISSILIILVCLVFTVGIQYKIYADSKQAELKSKAYLIGLSVSADGLPDYSFAAERITLIDRDGNVIYDNKASAVNMENHAKRAEFVQALKEGEGYAVRTSETLGENACYYAIRLDNGNVLRVADTALSVGAVILQLLPSLSAVALIVLAVALVLASTISKRVLKPLNSMNLDGVVTDAAYKELTPFVEKINSQRRKIDRQIAELSRSRREFEAISENMREGLLLTDTKGYILSHNSSIRRFFGLREDMNGQNLLSLNRSETFREMLVGVGEGMHYESIMAFGERYYQITANPVLDENETLCGAAVLVIDITEKEKREKHRREFTANVSHELKTPLTSILGISDMLQNGMVKPGDVKDFAQDINREAQRLLSLVNDIIKLSELDEGRAEATDRVDLLKTAKQVAASLEPIAAKRGVSLSVTGESAEITAGESLIFEMIYNLCDNALKYNKENGIVTVTAGYKDGAPSVSVKDTGIGIAPEHVERVFERFYRVDKSRSKQSGGTGLGLSIVKHIALAFGGTIDLKSAPGEGTQVTVTFGGQ